MNAIRKSLVVVILLAAGATRAANSDFEIHCAPRKTGENAKAGAGEGSIARVKESWVYDVTIENKTFKPLADLEVKYVVFFTHEKLGAKGTPELARKSGGTTLPALGSHEKKTFATEAVELKKAHLVGNYHYPSGARPNAQDTLAGIWVRIYQGGQQLGEYANPSTLMKEKWD